MIFYAIGGHLIWPNLCQIIWPPTFKKTIGELYYCGKGKINLFSLFIERGMDFLHKNGVLSYIIPNTFFRATTYRPARELIVKKYAVEKIVDLHGGVFENVTASTTVIQIKKTTEAKEAIDIVCNIHDLDSSSFTISRSVFNNPPEYVFSIYQNTQSLEIQAKMTEGSILLKEICSYCIEGIVTPKGKNDFISDEQKNSLYKPFLEGKDINKYQTLWRGKYILFDRKKLHRPRPDKLWEADKKILIRRIGGGNWAIYATLDDQHYYTYASVNNMTLREDSILSYEYVLCLLNSKLLNWYYIENFTNRSGLTVNISKTYLDLLPLKNISYDRQKPFVEIARKILALTSSGDYQLNDNKQRQVREYEVQIDQMVYELYGLNNDEIAIIEQSINRSS